MIVPIWTYYKKEYRFSQTFKLLFFYNIDSLSTAAQVSAFVKGVPSTLVRNINQGSFSTFVQTEEKRREDPFDLETIQFRRPKKLCVFLCWEKLKKLLFRAFTPDKILKEQFTFSGTGQPPAVTHINKNAAKTLEGLNLPSVYSISNRGGRKTMDESFSALKSALLILLVLLYFSLIPAFRSFIRPVTIMVAIPLGIIGAELAMLLMGKHRCQPAFMWMILLAGIGVKNSVMLIDFILEARERGPSLDDGLIGSVRVRPRPILMRAAGTAVGMIPIALEGAIRLEKLSPLAVVAIYGIMASTFLT